MFSIELSNVTEIKKHYNLTENNSFVERLINSVGKEKKPKTNNLLRALRKAYKRHVVFLIFNEIEVFHECG